MENVLDKFYKYENEQELSSPMDLVELKLLAREHTDKTRRLKASLLDAQAQLDQMIYTRKNLEFYRQQLEQDLFHCQQFKTVYDSLKLYSQDKQSILITDTNTAANDDGQHEQILSILKDELEIRKLMQQQLRLEQEKLSQKKQQLLAQNLFIQQFDARFSQIFSQSKQLLLSASSYPASSASSTFTNIKIENSAPSS